MIFQCFYLCLMNILKVWATFRGVCCHMGHADIVLVKEHRNIDGTSLFVVWPILRRLCVS